MIDYELARELKDNGFPFDWEEIFIDVDNTHKSFKQFPTLEKLIEACGDKFETLRQVPDADGNYVWYCFIHTGLTIPSDDRLGYSTPSEAVAKLWLALHKTKIVIGVDFAKED